LTELWGSRPGPDLIVASVPLLILHVSIGVFLSLTWGRSQDLVMRGGLRPQPVASPAC